MAERHHVALLGFAAKRCSRRWVGTNSSKGIPIINPMSQTAGETQL